MQNLSSSVIAKAISVKNFRALRKGMRVFLGKVPGTIVARPVNGAWVSFQEDPELKEVLPTREEIMRDILMKRTSSGKIRERKWEEVKKKPVKIFLRTLKRDEKENRKAAALLEYRGERKGVKETYQYIFDPRVTAAQMEKDLKAKRNMKRMFLRRRAKLATV